MALLQSKKKAIVQWFYQMGTPVYFHKKAAAWSKYAALIGSILFVIGVIWGLGFAPPDYQQGDSFRIIFIHVPAASAAMTAYVMLAVWGAIFLVWRIKMVDILAEAIIPIGAMLTAISLITGAIWGIPTWGTAWAADARILSMAFLLFLYVGIFLLRSQITPFSKAQKLASLLAFIGVINIPVIKYSVEWFTTLHQGATFSLTKKPSMPPSMYQPLIFTLLGTYFLLFAWVMDQARRVVLQRELGKKWVSEWLKNR